MNHDSIYNDLATFTVPANVIKVVDSPPRTRKKASVTAAQPRARGRPKKAAVPAADITINDVIAMVVPPLTVIRNATGAPIHTDSTLAVRCDLWHMHKYPISDIVKGRCICLTCTHGNIFLRSLRETAEDLAGTPFINIAPGVFESPVYKIAIASALPSVTAPDHAIRVGVTRSVRKMRTALTVGFLAADPPAALRARIAPTRAVIPRAAGGAFGDGSNSADGGDETGHGRAIVEMFLMENC